MFILGNVNTENIFYCLNIFKFETHPCPLKNSIYEPHATNMSSSSHTYYGSHHQYVTDPFPCFTSIILLSQVFSTLPVKGQVSEVVSENIYPLHEYKEDTKSSISFLNHGATNCKEKKRLLGQKNSQWCVKKGWGKKENDKYTLWPTFCKSFWKFIFPWLWVTMPSVVSIIDYNRSSITSLGNVTIDY